MTRNVSLVRWSFLSLLTIFAVYAFPSKSSTLDQVAGQSFTDSELIDYYKYISFRREFDGLELDVDGIAKRDQERLVSIITLPQPSVPVADSFSAVKAVAENLEIRSNGLSIKIFSPEDVVQWNAENEEYKSKMFSDVIAIYVGSREELIDLIDRASENSPELRSQYEKILQQNPSSGRNFCSVILWPHGDGGPKIGLATAFIESGPKLDACLYEELMQSFGMANDFPAGTLSIFNDDNTYDTPTDLDWQLWHIHTDPLLKAGMKQPEALEIVRQILSRDNSSAVSAFSR